MNLLKDLEFRLLTENATFAKMQQVIYDYVTSKIRADKDTIAALKEIVAAGDFWDESFDYVYDAMREKSFYGLDETIARAISVIAHSMEEHLGEANDGRLPAGVHFPDTLRFGKIPRDDIFNLIKQICPEAIEKQKKDDEEYEQAKAKTRKVEIESITDEVMKETATFVKKWDDFGWKYLFQFLAKQYFDAEQIKDFIPQELHNENFDDVKSEKDLKELFKKKVSAREYMVTVFENIMQIPQVETALNNKNQDVVSGVAALRIIQRDDGLSKKFMAMI